VGGYLTSSIIAAIILEPAELLHNLDSWQPAITLLTLENKKAILNIPWRNKSSIVLLV
jgi:hypothetical protein